MEGFKFSEMMVHGWIVLSVLGVGSILTWTIIFDRLIVMWRAGANAAAFVRDVIWALHRNGQSEAVAFCGSRKPVAVVCGRILKERGTRQDRERAMKHALQGEIRRLQSFLPILGTIASAAPFVGLLGTVIGIIKAFRDIASNVGGGPEVVSAGVAEALITTAAGLVVAIPAVIGYNYFVHRVRRLAEEIDLAAYDLLDELDKTGKGSP